MGNNYAAVYSNVTTTTKFTVASMSPPIQQLDRLATLNKIMFMSCEGLVDWEESTGTLSWSGILHIYFNREDGTATHNQVAVGSLVLINKEFAAVTLSETNDAAVTVVKGTINDSATPATASNFKTLLQLCLGHAEESDLSGSELMFYPAAVFSGLYFPTTYNDINFDVGGGSVGPSTPTSVAFTTNTKQSGFGVGNNMDLNCTELAHWWKEGSTVQAHMHITTLAVPTPNEYFQGRVYVAYQDASNDWQEISRDSGDVLIAAATPTLRGFYVSLGAVIDFAGLPIGKQFLVRVERIASSGTAYTGNMFINSVGFHAIKDYPGSRIAGTK